MVSLQCRAALTALIGICSMTHVKNWTADGVVAMQGCFDCTDWHMFYDTCENLNEPVDAI